MENFYHQQDEAKKEEKKRVPVKETRNLESKTQLEITTETQQNLLQATSSDLKTGAIASLRGRDDKVPKFCSSEKPDVTEFNKCREGNNHSLKSPLQEEIINLKVSDSLKIEQKKFESEDDFQEVKRNASPLGQILIPDSGKSKKGRESKKRGLALPETFKGEDSKEYSKKMKTEGNTSENVTKRKCRRSLHRRLRRKGLSLLPVADLEKEQQPILRVSDNNKDSLNNFCLLNNTKNTLIEKCGSSEKPDGPDVSSLKEGKVKPEVSDSCRIKQTEAKGVALLLNRDSNPENCDSLKIERKTLETEEVFQEINHSFSPLVDRKKPDNLESNEDGKRKKLGVISTESSEDEDGKESSKKLKTQERASEDVKERKGRSCLERRLRERRLAQQIIVNKPLGEVDKIQEFGSLEIPNVSASNKDGEYKQQIEENKPKLAVSSLQEGDNKSPVYDSGRIKHTETIGVELLLKRDNNPETSDSLTTEQKMLATEEVFQEIKHNFSPLENRQKPDTVESNEGDEIKDLVLVSTESIQDVDYKESSKTVKIPERASEDVKKRKGRRSLKRRLRDKRLAQQLLVNKPLSEVDTIQKSDSLEIPNIAESNKDSECKQETTEITAKPAVSSLQEEKKNPPSSDLCQIEQTNSKDKALSSKRVGTPETSDSLETGQKKFEAKEVFQGEVKKNSENADPWVTEENPSRVHESLKVDNSSLKDSSIVMKKSETAEIPPTVVTSFTGPLTSYEVENHLRVSESLETTCETSKNDSSLGTTEVENIAGAAQASTVKRKRKKKKKKLKSVEGIVHSQLGNQGAQTQKQENLNKKNKNKKKVKPSKPQAKKSQTPNRFITNSQFSFQHIWQYAANRSNTPIYQEPLPGYPPALPLMPRNLVGNPRHFLYHQSLIGSLGLPSLIQESISGNQVTPSMNQESNLGNRGVSPLVQLKLPTNQPTYQGNPPDDPGNLSRYYENLGDQPRNHSMIWNEMNPSSNEVKSEKPDRSQSNIGRQPRWEPPGNLHENQNSKEHLIKWEPLGNLQGNQDSKGNLSRWESVANQPRRQEYPPRYQDDLLAQPSTSKSEIQSTDTYHSGECSSRKRKHAGSRDSHSPDDCKRNRSPESELTTRNNNLFKLIISKDFGRLRLGQEELMLIRIAISQEIDRIPKGHIPKFKDTFLKVYGIVVDCVDEWSRDWLADTITKISPWAGARLRLVDLPQTEKFHDALLFIPGMVEKAEIILGRLERQNPALKTGMWKVYAVEEKCEPKGFYLKLGIPVTSLRPLQDLNFQPFLGMTKVTIAITRSVRIIDLDKEFKL